MPTYSYKCTACANAFDTVQSFSDPALTTCEVCGGTLRKVFSPVGVTFNGSGFYRTDSRAKSSESGAGSSSKPDSGSASGSSPKSDSSSGSSSAGSSSSGSAAPASTSAAS